LFTADPRRDMSARLVSQVVEAEIPQELWDAARSSGSSLGTGGMMTKLQAADLARRSGSRVVIASGDEPDIILRLAGGEALGTQFHALTNALESRKRFILAGSRSAGAQL
jgi:glutamate 5-kinase